MTQVSLRLTRDFSMVCSKVTKTEHGGWTEKATPGISHRRSQKQPHLCPQLDTY